MSDRQFGRKREGLSWHSVTFHTRGLDTWATTCGRVVAEPLRDVLPYGEPTCNTCLAINTRKDEQLLERAKANEEPEPEDDGSTHDESEPA